MRPRTLAVPIHGGVPRNICVHMLSKVVSRREVLLCRERPERFPDLRGKDARDSCAGWQVVAGSARCGNQRCRWGRWTARRRDDRGWPDLARTRPLNLRLHQDRLAAQSLSHTPALAGSDQRSCVDVLVAPSATQQRMSRVAFAPAAHSVPWGAPDVDSSLETLFVQRVRPRSWASRQ